jgi:hypothetical protein
VSFQMRFLLFEQWRAVFHPIGWRSPNKRSFHLNDFVERRVVACAKKKKHRVNLGLLDIKIGRTQNGMTSDCWFCYGSIVRLSYVKKCFASQWVMMWFCDYDDLFVSCIHSIDRTTVPKEPYVVRWRIDE